MERESAVSTEEYDVSSARQMQRSPHPGILCRDREVCQLFLMSEFREAFLSIQSVRQNRIGQNLRVRKCDFYGVVSDHIGVNVCQQRRFHRLRVLH